MAQVKISLELTFTTPPSVGAGGASETLADKVVTRNARGLFIIPASQVKGKLRHACEQLLRANDLPLCQPPSPERMCPNAKGVTSPCLICQIFGSPLDRCKLRFHDLQVVQADLPTETLRSMVSLNRFRRTAEAHRLFLVETAPNVNGLKFGNQQAITGWVSSSAHVHVLLAGLRMLFTWGGGTSRGLGWGVADANARLDGDPVLLNVEEIRSLCRS
jgi:CRISPR/Cas system CSM-associated protein Csm3 (group 7 of RAMP superfamily)